MSPQGAIDAYLDRLFDHLAGTGGRGRRILAEAEDHLLQAVEEATANGVDPAAAEVEALARFGDARVLAAAARPRPSVPSRLLTAGWLLGGAAILVYCVSGLLTWAARWPYAHLVTALSNANSDPSGPIYFASVPSDARFRELCSGPTHRPCLVIADDGPPSLFGLGDLTGPLQFTLVLVPMIAVGLAMLAPLWFGSRRRSVHQPPMLAPLVGLGGAVLFGAGVLGTVQGGLGDPLWNLSTGTVLAMTAFLLGRRRRVTADHSAAWATRKR